MTGRITGISGPTARVALRNLKLYERVYVGQAMLTGEVVRLEQDSAVVQIYEDTRGLSIGEPVIGSGTPLTVQLGPGLLSSMFDGLQRPLTLLREKTGPFIISGSELHPLDYMSMWNFTPIVKHGDEVGSGKLLGYVDEGPHRHFITCPITSGRRIAKIYEGKFSLNDSLGEYDDGSYIVGCHEWPVRRPRPFKRKLFPSEPVITGQRAIDFLFPLARGGTAIFPGGFGTGKTVLEHSISKFANADIVVYVGCGERGNEMADLIAEFQELNDPWTNRLLTERTIQVINTSNMPVAAREASIYTAITMAEYYRDMGYHVLLLADSMSRWAEALREISSSLEEMPGEEGYPTYLASRLSGLIERAGVVETLSGKIGSLTTIMSVSPPGGDFTEPVTQACLRTAGAFLMLDTELAHRRHFPAIHWFQSYSLYTRDLEEYYKKNILHDWSTLRKECIQILHREESIREVAEIVGSEGLQDADRLIMITAEEIRSGFLAQNAFSNDAFSPLERTIKIIRDILQVHNDREKQLSEGVPLDTILAPTADE